MSGDSAKDRVRLVDVAKAAGVSHMTVSRVINDDPAVAERTAARVRRSIEALGYVPPPPEVRFRRPSRRKYGIRTENIALVFPDVEAVSMRTALSAALAQGIEGYLHGRELNLIVTHLRAADEAPNCVEKRQVDGLICRSGNLSAEVGRRLAELPLVYVFGRHEDADSVDADDEAIGALAAERLVARGHGRVACVNPMAGHPGFEVRLDAFRRAAGAAGMTVAEVETTQTGGGTVLGRLLGLTPRPEGVFFAGFTSEAPVEGTLRGLGDAGFGSGGESVVACVNFAVDVGAVGYALTQIDIQPEEIGRTAAQQLLWRMRHPEEAHRRLLVAPRVTEMSPAPAGSAIEHDTFSQVGGARDG
jgi:LacI family transcriptional regulator